jgi:deoxyribodipyrimidine photolyase-related protein
VTASAFAAALARRNPPTSTWGDRRFVFVPYDQLSAALGPLAREPAERLGIVLVENPWKAARRPYHKQKLALVLANLRHFALEQADRGVAVAHVVHDGRYRDALAPLVPRLGPLRAMQPAERELRRDLQPLVSSGGLELLPHEGWLTTPDDFELSQRGQPRWRMDRFYRHVRQSRGVLVDARGRPTGGAWSFDAQNRKPWCGTPPAPEPPRFAPDAVTREVGALIGGRYAHHPGTLDLGALPATRADAQAFMRWALRNCLPHFGPYEDAMSSHASGLFHSRLSPLVNLHRLTPAELLQQVLDADLPLNSQEGFVRQLLGWREYMHHVHVATDGLRELPDAAAPPRAPHPLDGGYARWAGMPWRRGADTPGDDGGACPSHLDAERPLPPALWGAPSGLNCLDTVVADVWREAWSHHITRLMIVGNLMTLLDTRPRELTDWFWAAYQDAYDWVVEPNVLGMASFGVGALFMTKPYVAGAAYIDRMSDYCKSCRFDPKRDCPVTPMYWAFLERKRPLLQDNARLQMPLRALAQRAPQQRARDARVFENVSARLVAGEVMTPADVWRDV